MRVATVGTLCGAIVALLGCSGNECTSATADCQGQIRLNERVYTSYGFTALGATKFGKADRAECHDEGCDAQGSVFPSDPDQVTVWSFQGYSTDQVVGVRFDDDSFRVFVADSVPDRDAERLFTELGRATPEKSPFERFNLGGTYQVEHFTSVADLASKADLIVVGTVTGGRWGNSYGDRAHALTDLIFEVSVDSVISGNPVSRTPGAVDVVIDVVDRDKVKLNPPIGAQAIFILRRTGAPIPGLAESQENPDVLAQKLYRPVSSAGIIDEGLDGLVFPLGFAADWATTLLSKTLDQAAQHLRRAAG